MKRLSLQWRITLMSVLLIGITCVAMNLLLCSSGVYYMDTIADSLQDGGPVILNEAADGVHIVQPGGAEQQLHGNAGRADEQHGQQRDAPLQRKPLHSSSPPIR